MWRRVSRETLRDKTGYVPIGATIGAPWAAQDRLHKGQFRLNPDPPLSFWPLAALATHNFFSDLVTYAADFIRIVHHSCLFDHESVRELTETPAVYVMFYISIYNVPNMCI